MHQRVFLDPEGFEGREGEDGKHDQGTNVIEQQQQRHTPGEGLQEEMETWLEYFFVSWGLFTLTPHIF